MKFCELAVGAHFVFREKRYQKTAMSMARDEKDWGTIFMAETEVEATAEEPVNRDGVGEGGRTG